MITDQKPLTEAYKNIYLKEKVGAEKPPRITYSATDPGSPSTVKKPNVILSPDDPDFGSVEGRLPSAIEKIKDAAIENLIGNAELTEYSFNRNKHYDEVYDEMLEPLTDFVELMYIRHLMKEKNLPSAYNRAKGQPQYVQDNIPDEVWDVLNRYQENNEDLKKQNLPIAGLEITEPVGGTRKV